MLRQFSGGATRKADNAFVEFLQNFLVDAGLVVEALEIRARRKTYEVAKAGEVHGQQREVIAGLLHAAGVPVETAARSDVGFHPQDRIEIVGATFGVEFAGAVEVAVVGNGARVHPHGLRRFDEVGDFRHSIEQAVMRVAVEMNERTRSGHGFPAVGERRLFILARRNRIPRHLWRQLSRREIETGLEEWG